MPYKLIVLGFHTYSSTFFGMVPPDQGTAVRSPKRENQGGGIFFSGHLLLLDVDNVDVDNVVFFVIVSLTDVHREIGA
jgi:hypothetical protein